MKSDNIPSSELGIVGEEGCKHPPHWVTQPGIEVVQDYLGFMWRSITMPLREMWVLNGQSLKINKLESKQLKSEIWETAVKIVTA